MTKIERLALATCRDVGLHVLEIEHRGKHNAVVCREGRIFCSASPSDGRRYLHNLKQTAKKLLAAAA
jgi:hypothetical protein